MKTLLDAQLLDQMRKDLQNVTVSKRKESPRKGRSPTKKALTKTTYIKPQAKKQVISSSEDDWDDDDFIASDSQPVSQTSSQGSKRSKRQASLLRQGSTVIKTYFIE